VDWLIAVADKVKKWNVYIEKFGRTGIMLMFSRLTVLVFLEALRKS